MLIIIIATTIHNMINDIIATAIPINLIRSSNFMPIMLLSRSPCRWIVDKDSGGYTIMRLDLFALCFRL